MSTPPGPRGETPAEQPEPEAPTVEGPAVPAADQAAEREPATAHAAEAPPAAAVPPEGPAAATTPAGPSRGRRFLGWARTPVGVGVVVAAAMLLFLVIPAGLIGFAAGHDGPGGRGGWDDRRVHVREFDDRGERSGGRGDGPWGPRGHRDSHMPPVAPGAPAAPATPAPSASATASG